MPDYGFDEKGNIIPVNPDKHLWDEIKQDIRFEQEWEDLRHYVVNMDKDSLIQYAKTSYSKYLRVLRYLALVQDYDYWQSPYADEVVHFSEDFEDYLKKQKDKWFNAFNAPVDSDIPIYLKDVKPEDILQDYAIRKLLNNKDDL